MVAYVAIGVVTVIGFLLSAQSLNLVFASRFARTQALLAKNKILSRIDREVALAQKLADDPIVRLWAVDEDNQRVKTLAMDQLESYRRSFADHSYFFAPLASLHYYIHNSSSRDDTVQVTTLSPTLPADRWYFDTLKSVESFALNVDYDRLIEATKVWINVILRNDGGQKIGIGGTGIDITDFLKTILEPAESNAITILVDRAGVIQAHPNAAYVLRNAEAKGGSAKLTAFDLIADRREADWLRGAISDLSEGRAEVLSTAMTVEGKRYLAALSSMPEIGWFNLVLVDASHVLRARDFLPLAAAIFVSLLLLLLVVAVILSRAVLRPLSALATASREITAGRYGVQIPAGRSDEMGQLTSAFNTMSATVRSTTEGLETRVQERTRALTSANTALRESQQLIMESLSYARRVQAGILPGPEELASILPERLVLYSPRDVVGGDLYLVRRFPGRVVAAVVDCMGHGVPGAFVSMTVHAVLTHVLDAVCSDDPARIIAELDRGIRETLHRDGSDKQLDSGLDIALCVVAADGSAVFSGAGLPLFLWDGRTVTEMKGDQRRAGYRSPGSGASWTNRAVPRDPALTLYLVTDGFLDQAGGEKGFGFGRRRFTEMIARHAALPLGEQEAAFRADLRSYQGDLPQRDDITILGFRGRRMS
jgi:sigma-B regulation protein RsbU (phosphoserine phosphatase)